MEDAVAEGNVEILDIIPRGRLGDCSAFGLEQLYDEHAESLYRYALALTSSREDAEDVVQTVFARFARSKVDPKSIENPKHYFLTAIRNSAFSILRSRRRRDDHATIECDERDYQTEDVFAQSVDAIVLMRAFERLPAEQREVLVLKVYEGMTLSEIAHATRVSVGTVSSRYNYALRRLKAALEDKADGQ
jgi:RNA polymerase sigma-70 factor, ECF subfamily